MAKAIAIPRGTILLSPEGSRVTRAEWDEFHRVSPSPYLLSEHVTPTVIIRLLAADRIANAGTIPESFWKYFQVEITNVISKDSEGVPLKEPRQVLDPDSRGFVAREDAEAFYKEVVEHFMDGARETTRMSDYAGPPGDSSHAVSAPVATDVPKLPDDPEAAEKFGDW